MKQTMLFVVFAMSSLIGFSQVPSYVPTDGLVGYWPFNGNANDESGNGNDGTVNGAILTADRNGFANAAYSFNGLSNYIDCGPVNQINTTVGELTQSAWFLAPTDQSSFCKLVIMTKRQAENDSWPSIYAGGNGSQGFEANKAWYFLNASNYVQGVTNALYSNALTNDGNWHLITATKSGTEFRLYFDGVLQSSLNDNYTLSSNSNLIIGYEAHWGFDCERWFSGKLDDIGIWNRALTEQEIQTLYIGCNMSPTSIAGNLSPSTFTSATYACNNNSGSTYLWTVTNGVITAGQGTSNVTVLWGSEGIGTLSVVETNSEGCSGAPANIQVDVVCSTTATTITGPLGPNALTSTTYSCNGDAGSTYQWTISNGVITAGQGTNTVTVLWAGTGLGNISVQETTNANCVGNTISMDVVVIPTGVDEVKSPITAIYPNPATDIVTIDFGKASSVHGQSIKILNSVGQVVYSSNVTSQLAVVDVSTWASGTYLISVLNDTGTQVQTKTLIIE